MLTERELRRLPKKRLASMVVELTNEAESLKEQLAQANAMLADRTITIDNAGSIAEASMQLNEVFTAAQKAADLYIENIKKLSDRQQLICEQREMESKAEAERLLAESRSTAETMVTDATKKSETMVNVAKQQSQSYWLVLQNKLESFYDAHKGLKQMLEIPVVMATDEGENFASKMAERAEASTKRLFEDLDAESEATAAPAAETADSAEAAPAEEVPAEASPVEEAATETENNNTVDAEAATVSTEAAPAPVEAAPVSETAAPTAGELFFNAPPMPNIDKMFDDMFEDDKTQVLS